MDSGHLSSDGGEEDVCVFPASFAQQRLWFLDQFEPGASFYNIPTSFRVKGPYNIAALEQSLNEIVRRHETLRTTFSTVDGEPMQVIAPNPRIAVPVVNLSGVPESQREAEAYRLMSEEGQRPFDLGRGPLFRATLLRLSEADHVLLLTMHHIISDGWSMGVLLKELTSLYEAFSAGRPSPLPELPIQYADFAQWQREWLQGEVLNEHLSYWKQHLGGAPALLELPTDRPRPPVQVFRGAPASFQFSAPLSQALLALSQREGVTLFMTLLAAFNVLLYRYTGQRDLVVGVPIANRTRAELEGLIGFFINTLALRTHVSGDPSFRELLQQVRETTLGAYGHQDLPFEKLVEELQPERNLSYNPLFQVMFVLQNVPLGPEQQQQQQQQAEPAAAASGGSPPEVGSGTAKFDLTLFMMETAAGLIGGFEYNTDLFDPATIWRMIGHLQTLLEGIVAQPDQRVSELPLLTEAERQTLLASWNGTKIDAPSELCLHQLFEAQAKRTPDAVALRFRAEALTYDELDRRSSRVARYLGAQGVGPGTLVGLCTERSIEMVVGLLGILKAGGAYVPFDPAYPRDRLAFMVADSATPVILTQQRVQGVLPESGSARIIRLDADWELIAATSDAPVDSGAGSTDLAYTLFTSGSTGRPKGVAIEHRSAVALIAWAMQVYSAEELAGVLFATSICFDLSVFELFVPLSLGGKVILVESVLDLATLPTANEVTLINSVPSAFAEVLRMGAVPSSVRTVNLAGEPLTHSLAQQIYQQRTILRLVNLYGPTESTTYATFAEGNRQSGMAPPIGRPIAGTQVYVLDSYLNPVPIGVPGELHIGGVGVAQGYLNRPDLTAEKFVPDRFGGQPGAHLYRTGDRVRYLPDGNLDYLGRIDHQVKIRGFRIELGELRAVLLQHPAIADAVVIAREDAPGDKRLVAYLVARPAATLSADEVRSFVREKLPEYMVPAVFLILEALPLTPNGKVDLRALPAPDNKGSRLDDRFVAPRNSIEEALSKIWIEILGIKRVGVNDSFFELGGHSLLATRVISQVRQIFGMELPIRRFFEAPRIAALAEAIVESLGIGDDEETARALEEIEQLSPKETRT